MKEVGTGSVTRLRNGRFWVRGPKQPDGSRPGLGTFGTKEEADEILATAVALSAAGTRSRSITFEAFGREVFRLREDEGVRGVEKELRRFDFHLAKSAIGNMSLVDIASSSGVIAELGRTLKRKDAADKRAARKISHRTVTRCMSLVSIIFDAAVERGLVDRNPCVGVKLRRRADEAHEDVWTFLSLEEQRRLVACEEIPHADRVIIRCALGSGIREGELAHAYLTDLHLDGPEPFLHVRFASRKGGVDLPPKNKKPRKVPLFGDGLLAFREWVEIRKTYIRPTQRHEVQQDVGLIFPTVTGCRRASGKPLGGGRFDEKHPRATANGWVDRLADYYHLAGIPDRPGLHWHSLRHTCATSLLEGFWGPPWAIEEVSQQLGHSSIAVTQRYAHPSGVRLRAAAARSQAAGYGLVTNPVALVIPHEESPTISGSHLPGLNRRPAVYEGPTISLSKREVELEGSPGNGGLVTTLAATVLDLIRRGKTEAALAVAVSLASASVVPLQERDARDCG